MVVNGDVWERCGKEVEICMPVERGFMSLVSEWVARLRAAAPLLLALETAVGGGPGAVMSGAVV